MALQWTYENISYFGGNASNISVGGYSAGAHSVFHQLAYDLGVPNKKAIIKRAFMLSNGPGMQPKTLEETELQLEELLHILDVSKALTPAEQLENLRGTDAKTLIHATHKMKLHQFRAVTDGSFVRHGLMDELSQGSFARRMKHRGVELLIGECSDEHYVYGTWRPPKPGLDNMLQRLEADYPRNACKVLAAQYFPNRKLPSKYKDWQAAFGHIYADVQIHALGRGMVSALVKHGAGHLVHRYRIEWRAKCVDKKYPVAWGATHSADMAMWFWGNGESLTKEEKTVAAKAFHKPLGMFLQGGKMAWGTEHAMQIRTLKADGSVAIEEDTRLEEGLVLWNALERVGSTGHSNQSKL
jgi:carboxylesterase type B